MEPAPRGYLDRAASSRRHFHLRGLFEDFSAEYESVAILHFEIFHIHEPLELRYPGGSVQDAAGLGSAVRRSRAAFHGNYSRAACSDWLAAADLGPGANADHV